MLVPTRRCPPCKAIAPEIEKLSAEEGNGAVVFLKVDVDKAEDAAADNGISAMPTFIFFKKESKVNSFSKKPSLGAKLLRYVIFRSMRWSGPICRRSSLSWRSTSERKGEMMQ